MSWSFRWVKLIFFFLTLIVFTIPQGCGLRHHKRITHGTHPPLRLGPQVPCFIRVIFVISLFHFNFFSLRGIDSCLDFCEKPEFEILDLPSLLEAMKISIEGAEQIKADSITIGGLFFLIPRFRKRSLSSSSGMLTNFNPGKNLD